MWQSTNKQGTLRDWNVGPEDAMESLVGQTFAARVEDLLPNTLMTATVAVMNNYYVSRPSDPYEFTTMDGCEWVLSSSFWHCLFLGFLNPQHPIQWFGSHARKKRCD